MALTFTVVCVSCATMILLILIKPSFSIGNISLGTYWMAAFIGALVLIIFGSIGIKEVFSGLTAKSAINPLKILALFISMTILSIFLDEAGFFRYMASAAAKKCKTSQTKLFFALYAIVSILTIFTSNDIIVLTFTPFICYFAKNAKINPAPYLFAEFVAANTWSMMLIIGNPTNIYLATSAGIGFTEYVKTMALPTVSGGLASLLTLYLLFRKKLKKPIEYEVSDVKIEDKILLWIGLLHLGACTILLALSGYFNIEMWFITVCFALSLFICIIIYKLIKKEKLSILKKCLSRAPWELAPFVLSMFILVLALEKHGFTQKMAFFLNKRYEIIGYGLGSVLFSNLMNNIPMSVLFSSVISFGGGIKGVYAAIIGSNIGAFVTPVGALAGIMWIQILRINRTKFKFADFIKYGIIIAIPTLVSSLGGLWVSLMFV